MYKLQSHEKLCSRGYYTSLIILGNLTANKSLDCFVVAHPYFVGVQYHPEYLSRPLKASPPYLGLILASIKQLETYISRDCKFSPRNDFYCSNESSDEEFAVVKQTSPPVSLTDKKPSNAPPTLAKPTATNSAKKEQKS